MKTYQLYINGQYVDPVNGEWFDTIDPYRGEAWAKIPRGTAADADKAVKAANEAMWNGPWTKMTASARGKAMRKLGDLVAANAERLAEIERKHAEQLAAQERAKALQAEQKAQREAAAHARAAAGTGG